MVTPAYSTVISPNDHMWKTGQPWYFEVGLSALECIKRALATANITPVSILDLPCGHGRVCRMLRMAFPDAHLSVSDLDTDGVGFCAEQFRAEPLYSREDIREVTTSRSFDLIWCGSLFTHLDRDRWAPFLGFFAAHLRPGGVLVFTTHGRRPIQWMVEGFYAYGLNPQEQRRLLHGYATEGFGFVSPANQAFGLSLSSTAFVCGEIERCRTLGLIGLHEAGWSDHQDVVACVKLPTPYLDAASCTVADEIAAVPGTRAAPRLDRPMGNVDEPLGDVTAVSRLRLSGWAGDSRGIHEVRVLMDGQVVAVSALNWDRPDVSATYPEFRHGTDCHGWRINVELPAPGAHRLSVQAVNIDRVSAEIGARVVTVPGI
jgi:SAM-dependent methyltransferase